MMSVHNLSFWIFIAEQGGIYFYNNKPMSMVRCVSDRYFPTIKFEGLKPHKTLRATTKHLFESPTRGNKSTLLYEQYRKY